jgi:hypothetical protein
VPFIGRGGSSPPSDTFHWEATQFGADEPAMSRENLPAHRSNSDQPSGPTAESRAAHPPQAPGPVTSLSLALRPGLIDRPRTEDHSRPPTPTERPAAIISLPRTAGASSWSYEIVTLDFGGRFGPRDAIDQLGWRPGGTIALRLNGDRVTARKVTRRHRLTEGAHRLDLDARGRLRLPHAIRQWLGVEPGDRIVVATSRRTATVAVMPVAVMDAIMERPA